MADADDLAERLLKIELAVSHLERLFEQLNESVLDHAAAVRIMRMDLDAIQARVEDSASESEMRDPGDERPPHY